MRTPDGSLVGIVALLVLGAPFLLAEHQPAAPQPVPCSVRVAHIWRVVDGDTVDVVLEVTRCRLLGIDAPEVRGPTRDAGLASKAWLVQTLPHDAQVILDGAERDKYGRLLVTIWRDGANVNDAEIAAGHAVRYRP